MGLNDTARAERTHIGFFGRMNVGKSSVVNAVAGQRVALVSDAKGTTTDPVQKSMELLPIGPVVLIDTAGLDDDGNLGKMRVDATKRILERTDIAVLVTDADGGLTDDDKQLVALFDERKIPYIVVFNKCDRATNLPPLSLQNHIYVSAKTGQGITELKNLIGALFADKTPQRFLVRDLIKAGDTVVLVTPVDEAAPKGRLILPQQQTIRDILDAHAVCVVTQVNELPAVLDSLKTSPALVITDSQAFKEVDALTPENIPLTSFSILFARYKGRLFTLANGAATLKKLKDGDTLLISEGCTHHRQCNDIGSVKLPAWITQYTGKKLNFEFSSGGEFPEDLKKYALVVHCGGCMLNEKEMHYRLAKAKKEGIPITNYGVTIAAIHGILPRTLSPFDMDI